MSLYPPDMPRQRAQIRLLQATTLVQDGDVGAGVTLVQEVVAQLPADHRTLGVRQSARAVLAALPDVEAQRNAAEGLRESLALPAAY